MIGSFCFYISNKHFNLTIMKKIFLSLAFLFGIGMSVMADNTMQIKNDTIAVEDGFKTIDLKEVPQSIKDAIAKKAPGSTLKSASLSLKQEGVKSYRVVYVTKEGVENSIRKQPLKNNSLFNDIKGIFVNIKKGHCATQ